MPGLSLRALSAVLCLMMLAGCTANTVKSTDVLRRDIAQPRILLMPPDVSLYEMNAVGDLELNALWTQSGESNLKAALNKHLAGIKADYAEMLPLAENDPHFGDFIQLQKLHSATGQIIRAFALPPATGLPGKEKKFNWGLGPKAVELGQSTDAQYALFVHVADSYSSSGRRAAQVAAALLLGVVMSGGEQEGYASLVDLKTGDIVWFNALQRESGDLRDAKSAVETAAVLLTDLPK